MVSLDNSQQIMLQDPPLTIHAQYVKDLSFENPHPFLAFKNDLTDKPPQIGIDIQVNVHPLEEKTFEVVLMIRADAKRDQSQLFFVEISYGGIVSIGPQVASEHINPLLMISCPALLFPYIRHLISDATRNGGFPPLMLDPVDFARIYEDQQNKEVQPSSLN